MVAPLFVAAPEAGNRNGPPVVIPGISPYFTPTSDPEAVHPLLLIASLQDPSGGGVPQAPPPTARIPRIEAVIVVDGRVDEPVWAQAAVLPGFRQYQPVDSRPGEQEPVVRVWYSPTAIHFGIVANDRSPQSIRAT